MSVPVNVPLRTPQSHFFCFRQNSSLVSFIFIWEWELIDRYKGRQPQHPSSQLNKKKKKPTLKQCQTISNYLRITCPSFLLLPRCEFLIQGHLPFLFYCKLNLEAIEMTSYCYACRQFTPTKAWETRGGKQLISMSIYQDVAINPAADE